VTTEVVARKPSLSRAWECNLPFSDSWNCGSGYYLHSELYGQPPQKSTAWAQHPQVMKKKGQAPGKLMEPKQVGKTEDAKLSLMKFRRTEAISVFYFAVVDNARTRL
jgi:hypothetical protein